MDTNVLALAQGEPINADQMRAMERAIAAAPQQHLPVRTFCGHGMVTRVLFIPAGTVLTGHRHLFGQHNHLLLGGIRVTTDDGVKELWAPEVIVSPPGTKRAAVSLTDVVWSTTVICDETDPEKIFDAVIDPSDLPPVLSEDTTP